jgi:hypothetical protein
MAYGINLCCNLVTDKAKQIFSISSQKICFIVYITTHIFPSFFLYFSFIFSCDRLDPVAFSALELTSSSQASGRTCDRRFGRTTQTDEPNTMQSGYICVPRTGFETTIVVYGLSLTENHITKPEYLPGWEGLIILFDNTSFYQDGNDESYYSITPHNHRLLLSAKKYVLT